MGFAVAQRVFQEASGAILKPEAWRRYQTKVLGFHSTARNHETEGSSMACSQVLEGLVCADAGHTAQWPKRAHLAIEIPQGLSLLVLQGSGSKLWKVRCVEVWAWVEG